MSRTTRRTKDVRSYNNFEDAEEFNLLKAISEAGNPRPSGHLCWNSPEWKTWRAALYFQKYSYSKQTFDEWRKAETTKFYSDSGWGNHSRRATGAPGWFVTRFCQRPFRAKCKQKIREAWQHGEWDGIIFPPYIRDAAWKYD